MMASEIDYASEYDRYWQAPSRIGESSTDLDSIAEKVAEFCGLGSVLDVGAGEGFLVAGLLRRGIDARGIDASEVVVARSSERIPGRIVVGSVLQLPYADESFDTVVSTDCMEHLAPSDVPKALREIHRVARRFVFLRLATTPDRDGRWHLTIEDRAWWETRCLEAGFRKHPAYYKLNPYEGLNSDGWQIEILLEKIPRPALERYPLPSLAAERNLHMDMLREVGERSDAHLARYLLAATFIRPGDVVLDAATGLGYGSYAMAELSEARSVFGVDSSAYAINYANENFRPSSPKVSFSVGDLPQCLKHQPDGSFDFIVSFETLEHVQDPAALLDEFERLLSPGGRLVVSVPNDWSDETGKDPNPYHLHVYDLPKLRSQIAKNFLPEAVFQQIASGCKTSGAWNSWKRMPRRLRRLSSDAQQQPPSEWWLMVGMKDPVGQSQTYRESVYGYSHPPEHLLQFERDYANPWLVRSMLEFQFRASDEGLLRRVASRVLEGPCTDISPDRGAALAVIGYQMLADPRLPHDQLVRFVGELEPFISSPAQAGHLCRFRVSLSYLKAKLMMKAGMFPEALQAFRETAQSDLSGFSPTLGTKVVDAAFEMGLLEASRGHHAAARSSWRLGVERAFALLSSARCEFVGDIELPLRFPLICAVEILDSAVRCIKALSLTSESSAVPSHRLYELATDCWKSQLLERWSAMQSMESMIRERDATIASQASMLQERWSAMQSMESMIRERDATIASQASMLQERWSAMQSMESMIRERDATIASQVVLLKNRSSALDSLRSKIRAFKGNDLNPEG